MRVLLKTTNFELTPALEELAQTKLVQPVQKLLVKPDQKADVLLEIELAKTTKHHQKGLIWRAEAQLNLPGLKSLLRAEAVAESLRAAVDEVKDELLKEIKKNVIFIRNFR